MGLVLAASATAACAKDGSSSCRIGPSDTGAVYLRFATLCDSTVNDSFTVGVSWRGVPRATASNPATSYGAWKTLSKALKCAGLTCVRRAGAYQWAVPLADLAAAATWGEGGSWAFGKRKWDELHLQFSVTAAYVSGVEGDTPTGSAECWVGYVPEYSVASASFDLDALTVALSRTDGWVRADDRWALEFASIGGVNVTPRGGELYGNWASVSVPVRSLRRTPWAAQLHAVLRVNAAYKPLGYTLCEADGYVKLADLSTCDTPSVTAAPTADGGAVVAVADSGDRGVPITRATVRLRDGLPCDVLECAVPGSVTLPCLPAGECVVEVTGTDALDSTACSRTVSETVAVAGSWPMLWDLETGTAWRLGLDVEWQRSATPEATVEKLAGRERSSAWYGTGAEVTSTLKASIVGGDAEVGAAVDALAAVRRAVVRMPDGYRRPVAVTGFSHERHVGYATVSFSLTEVAE